MKKENDFIVTLTLLKLTSTHCTKYMYTSTGSYLPSWVPIVELVLVTQGELLGVHLLDLLVRHAFTDTLKYRKKRSTQILK